MKLGDSVILKAYGVSATIIAVRAGDRYDIRASNGIELRGLKAEELQLKEEADEPVATRNRA